MEKEVINPEPRMYLFAIWEVGTEHQYEDWQDLMGVLLKKYATWQEVYDLWHRPEYKEQKGALSDRQLVDFLKTKIEIEFVSAVQDLIDHKRDTLLLGYHFSWEDCVHPVGFILQDEENANKIKKTDDWRKEARSQIEETFSHYKKEFERRTAIIYEEIYKRKGR